LRLRPEPARVEHLGQRAVTEKKSFITSATGQRVPVENEVLCKPDRPGEKTEAVSIDKLKPRGWILGRVSTSKCWPTCHYTHNKDSPKYSWSLALSPFRFSPISFRAPHCNSICTRALYICPPGFPYL